MSYADASLAYLRAVDYHYRMSLLGDKKRILGALNLLRFATRRRLLAK
jgi:hypothetical protein